VGTPGVPGRASARLRHDKEALMGLGVSLLLIAVGAILVWGLQSDVAGISEDAIGVILMIVGAAGLVISMIFWSSWGGPGYFGGRRRATYVEDGPAPPA
jgi:hypothetical protein